MQIKIQMCYRAEMTMMDLIKWSLISAQRKHSNTQNLQVEIILGKQTNKIETCLLTVSSVTVSALQYLLPLMDLIGTFDHLV